MVGGAKGKEISNSIMTMSSPRRQLRYRYLSPGQVVVTPDGYSFNGEGRVSAAFLIDLYQEEDLRSLYRSKKGAEDSKTSLRGNVEEIIEDARSKKFTSKVDVAMLAAMFGGVDIRIKDNDKRPPVVVPVIKIYEPNK